MAKQISVIPAMPRMSAHTPEQTQFKKRVGAYCRVSTDTEDQLSSYDAQVNYYEGFIKSKNEWEFAGIFADEGISGTNTKNRVNFQRMIDECMQGKIDMILTKSISRFARNTLDCLNYVRKLKEKGVSVFFEKENIDTSDAKGEVLLTILSSLAQDEARNISENTRWGIQKRMQDGKVRGTWCFLGYDSDKNGKLIINEEQAVVVRRIFREYIEGKSTGQIARGLIADGIKTGSGGSKWAAAGILNIIKNEKYCGDALLQKTYIEDFLTHKKRYNRGELQQYYVENSHEGIVSKEVFELAKQETLRRSNKKSGEAVQSLYPFSSKVVCAECGSFFGRKVWNSNDEYRRYIWQCRRKYKKDSGEDCRAPHIGEKELTAIAGEALTGVFENRNAIIRLIKENLNTTLAAKEDKKRESLERQIDEVKQQMINLVKFNTRKPDDQSMYTEEYIRLSDELTGLRNEKEVYDNADLERFSKRENARGLIDYLAQTSNNVIDFNGDIFNIMVEKVVFYTSDKMDFILKDGSTVPWIKKAERED